MYSRIVIWYDIGPSSYWPDSNMSVILRPDAGRSRVFYVPTSTTLIAKPVRASNDSGSCLLLGYQTIPNSYQKKASDGHQKHPMRILASSLLHSHRLQKNHSSRAQALEPVGMWTWAFWLWCLWAPGLRWCLESRSLHDFQGRRVPWSLKSMISRDITW